MNTSGLDKKVLNNHDLPLLKIHKTEDGFEAPLFTPQAPRKQSVENGTIRNGVLGYYRPITQTTPASPDKSSR